MPSGTHCWKHDIWYASLGECPRCLAEDSAERQREHFERQEEASREAEERHAEMAREHIELLREQEEAEQQRHEELLEHQRELEEQRREQREHELEAQREAWEEETERRREISEAETAHRREIAANAWQLQAESKRARGSELFSAGLHEEGLAKLNESVKEDPGNLDSWVSLASAYRVLEDKPNRDRAIRKQLGLLRLPTNGKYIGNFERTLAQISGLPPEFLVEFTNVVNDRCNQVEAGDSDTLDTWHGLTRLFKSISDPVGWRRSIQNQIRILNKTERLKDFVFVLDQIPHSDTELFKQVRDTLTSRAKSLRISKNDVSEMSKLLEWGFADQVCLLLRGMNQDLTVQGLLVWAHLKGNSQAPTREIDACLQSFPCDMRIEVRKQYTVAEGFFSNNLNLDPDRKIRNALIMSLRDQYVRWVVQISGQFKVLALQQVNMNAVREEADKWAKGAAAVAFVISMFLPTMQLKIGGAAVLCLAAYLVVREMLSKALMLEAASKGYQSLRGDEWNQWRTMLMLDADPYDSVPLPPQPPMPSAHLKIAFVAAGLVLGVIGYGVGQVYPLLTQNSVVGPDSTKTGRPEISAPASQTPPPRMKKKRKVSPPNQSAPSTSPDADFERLLPKGARIIEAMDLTAIHKSRVMMLWMLSPKQKRHGAVSDGCSGWVYGEYWYGPTRLSLFDTTANVLLNTITIHRGEILNPGGADEFNLPFAVSNKYYYVDALNANGEGHPALLHSRQFADDSAVIFPLFDYGTCSMVATGAFGYSKNVDQVMAFPTLVEAEGKAPVVRMWVPQVFAQYPSTPGHWRFTWRPGHGSDAVITENVSFDSNDRRFVDRVTVLNSP